jgi:formate-nitrite transporter family protein
MEKKDRQVAHIEARSTPETPVIYEIVRRHGEEEMVRPAVSLWWSGVAAGLSISFSLLAQAILRMHLPDAGWRELIVALGYPIGFLMAVLSRQQLFTETTITAVLPVMAERSPRAVANLARMWGIVLAANMVGTLFAACFCSFTPVISDDLRSTMLDVSREALQHGWLEMMFRAVCAGFLMAALVWIIPSAQSAQFHVIMMMTYVIAVSRSAHIVAGSVEAFLLMVAGELSAWRLFTDFFVPVLIGNIIGGTVLFAVISYAQVMNEV